MTLYQFYKFLSGKGISCCYRKFNGIYDPIKQAVYAWSNITLVIRLAKEHGFRAEMDTTSRVMIY